ncbi:hypothetical protein EDD86DRAFT_271138, partial [Gorgonomyces haynaldii]
MVQEKTEESDFESECVYVLPRLHPLHYMPQWRHPQVAMPDLDGLSPDLSIADQLKLLRVQEKHLLTKHWRQVWEDYRGPQSRWWERTDAQFSTELKKSRQMLSKEAQLQEMRTRMFLLDMHRLLSRD